MVEVGEIEPLSLRLTRRKGDPEYPVPTQENPS
jgi:hypothetical protein